MARNAHPEVTRQRILDAAQKLFAEKGYEHTSVQDIVNELGDLSKGAIYHHFSNKHAILEALSQRDWVQGREWAADLRLRDDLNGLEKLRAVIRNAVSDTGHLNIQRDEMRFLEDPTTLAQNLKSWQTEVADGFYAFIMEGIEDGSVTTEYPHEAAMLCSLLLNYWVGDAPADTELEPRLRCVATMLTAIGMPIFDEELIELTLKGFRAILTYRFNPSSDTTEPTPSRQP